MGSSDLHINYTCVYMFHIYFKSSGKWAEEVSKDALLSSFLCLSYGSSISGIML